VSGIRARPLGQRYAFVAAGVVFLALLAASGLRSTPGVLLAPWSASLGWDRGTISLAAAIGIFLYGLMGPFAAALMQRFGIRKVLIAAFAVMALSSLASAFMTAPWQLIATWGVFSGLATGCVAMPLGATVVNRWFVHRRGLMMGLLAASTATGNLIFLPVLAAISQGEGWRPVVLTVAAVTACLIPLIFLLLPERPQDAGLVPYGASPDDPPVAVATAQNPLAHAFAALGRAARKRDFWLLFSTFFVCGLTTNGLVGTHMISLCGDHGLLPVKAAGLLAMMGLFDLLGTTGSGWLTDRYDPRKLLFVYYLVRGLSLIYLPFSDFSLYSLSIFAVLYGLDWIATVPPTVRLANHAFGEADAPIVFGWISAGHQVGAATAALTAGVMREVQGQYLEAFVLAGAAGLGAAALALFIGRRPRSPAPAPA